MHGTKCHDRRGGGGNNASGRSSKSRWLSTLVAGYNWSMATSISAHFDGQFFVPDEPVAELRPGDRVEVTLVTPPSASTQEDKEWAETLRQAINLHPVASHVVDDGRESIYAGRGE
jgi:hypothetical protein